MARPAPRNPHARIPDWRPYRTRRSPDRVFAGEIGSAATCARRGRRPDGARCASTEVVMRNIVYFFVFDGFADWEAALALCEIRRPGDFRVRTVALERRPVQSMGGL